MLEPRPLTQMFVAVWIHDEKLSTRHLQSMITGLKEKFHYIRIFLEIKDFFEYVKKDRLAAKIILIISHVEHYFCLFELAAKQTDVFQNVYIFLPKVEGSGINLFTNTEDLFDEIHRDLQSHHSGTASSNMTGNTHDEEHELQDISCLQQQLSNVSLFSSLPQQMICIRHLDKKSSTALMYLSAVQILLSMKRDEELKEEEKEEMLMVCRGKYKDNPKQLDYVDELKNYDKTKAIEYYTSVTCLFRIVNQTLRTEDIKEIFPFRGYITDLHRALESKKMNGSSLTVYRGKTLTPSALQHLIDDQNRLIAMNGFLSTTRASDVGMIYAGNGQVVKERRSVLFEFHLNSTIKQPLANVSHDSKVEDEDEILFSIGTIWRIDSAKSENSLWRIVLEPCNELDATLDDIYKKYTSDGCTLMSLGDVLQDLGDGNGAERFYYQMLHQESLSDEMRGVICYKIGLIHKARKTYSSALEKLNEAIKYFPLTIIESTNGVPKPHYIDSNQSYLRSIHSNRGFMYYKSGESSKALQCYREALKVEDPTSETAELAEIHNNIGLLLFLKGEFNESCTHHEQAVMLLKDNHPLLHEYKMNLSFAKIRCNYLNEHK